MDQSIGGFPFLFQIDLVGFYITYRLWVAKKDTLGVAIAIVTLSSDTVDWIKKGVPEGTSHDTSFASNTFLRVDDDSLILKVFVTGPGWADFRTNRGFTVLTGHGKVESNLFPFEDTNSRATGVAHPAMEYRADHFTISASGASFRIYKKDFPIHVLPQSFPFEDEPISPIFLLYGEILIDVVLQSISPSGFDSLPLLKEFRIEGKVPRGEGRSPQTKKG